MQLIKKTCTAQQTGGIRVISREYSPKVILMKKIINWTRVWGLTFSVALLLFSLSCDREPVNNRPELPPLESLVMDFSAFDQQPGAAKSSVSTYENFFHAYLSVVFWNVASTATLAVPVAAYTHALNQDPGYLGDQTWEWSFAFTAQGGSYEAILTGTRISNEEFSMEMVISEAGFPDQSVKWFDGMVRYDHTHASWNLYGEEGVKRMEAEWNMNDETGEADLTYTYVEPGMEETGSYISYVREPEAVYDASYTISLSGGEILIEWNTTTLEGRVKDLSRFGDSEWHCWGSAANGLADIACE